MVSCRELDVNLYQLASVFTVERHRARDFGNLVHLIDFAWRFLNLDGLFVDRTRETQAYDYAFSKTK